MKFPYEGIRLHMPRFWPPARCRRDNAAERISAFLKSNAQKRGAGTVTLFVVGNSGGRRRRDEKNTLKEKDGASPMHAIIKAAAVAILVAVSATSSQSAGRLLLAEQIRLTTLLAGANHNVGAIGSGEALNQLVSIIRMRGIEVDPAPLEQAEIAHVRLRQGSRGVPFQSNTGRPLGVCLPVELLGGAYRVPREQFYAARKQILDEISTGQPHLAAFTELQNAVGRLDAAYRENNQLTPAPAPVIAAAHREVCHFLDSLKREIQTLIDNEGVAPSSYLRFHGNTLRDLVEHLNRQYLEFGPCGCERKGLATYIRIYELLLRHLQSFRGELIAELDAHLAERAAAAANEREKRQALIHDRAQRVALARQQRLELRRNAALLQRAYVRELAAAQYRHYWLYRTSPAYRTYYTRYYTRPGTSYGTTYRTYTYTISH